MTPTERTLKLIRADGWIVGITERWNPHAKIRQDLFGFIDMIALKRGHPVTAIQTTSGANHAKRREKILGMETARMWLSAEKSRLVVVSWAKRGPRGDKKTWTPRIEEITLEDFDHAG